MTLLPVSFVPRKWSYFAVLWRRQI